VIAVTIVSTLQNILAKKYNVQIDGYMSVFSKSKDNKVISIAGNFMLWVTSNHL